MPGEAAEQIETGTARWSATSRKQEAGTLRRAQVGVYHHVTGVDASSSASLAAYINTLTHTSEKQNKIISGLYRCALGEVGCQSRG